MSLLGKITGTDKAGKVSAAANRAAIKAETEMFDKNMAFQTEERDYQREQLQPWQEAGARGLSSYENLLQNPNQVRQDPGYQFALSEGLSGVENSAAARGGLLSGNTARGLMEYGQNYASNQFDKGLNRYGTLANYGSAAAGAQVQSSQQFASNTGNLYSNQGTNLANFHQNRGQIEAAQATSGFNNLMSIANLGLSAYGMMGGGGAGGGAGAMQNISGYGQQSLRLF